MQYKVTSEAPGGTRALKVMSEATVRHLVDRGLKEGMRLRVAESGEGLELRRPGWLVTVVPEGGVAVLTKRQREEVTAVLAGALPVKWVWSRRNRGCLMVGERRLSGAMSDSMADAGLVTEPKEPGPTSLTVAAVLAWCAGGKAGTRGSRLSVLPDLVRKVCVGE
ncbi:hypothetical protein [Streptomyces albidoflavus]|uniref:hypothetical protein n=1 Tax=Streptomyces albidoflavus TaxID=1886 RepID=UPI0033DF2236